MGVAISRQIDPADRIIYQGKRCDLVLRSVVTRTSRQEREVVIHPGAVIILPIVDDQHVVLIRNQRHTVHQELWELPAGTLEPGEDPAICAARELTEETGYVSLSIEPFGWFYTSPGILTEKMYAFVARNLKPGPQNLEDNEKIQVEVVRWPQILRMIDSNEIVDAKTIATLLKYFQRRSAVG